MIRILHVLSQLPDQTGSGIYLQSLSDRANRAGYSQAVVAGANAAQSPSIPSLSADKLRLVRFGAPHADLPFLMPGMSDVMPYPSSRWSELTDDQLDAYSRAFSALIGEAAEGHRPDLVHVNHLWLAAALTRQRLSHLPVVASCHGTGLRQAELCPHIARRVTPHIRRLHRIFALTGVQARRIEQVHGVDPGRVVVTGGAVDTDRFFAPKRPRDELWAELGRELSRALPSTRPRVVYVGKLAEAKGVSALLNAAEMLRGRGARFGLVLVGSGSGPEADQIQRRAERLGQGGDAPVVALGRLPHPVVARLLRASDLFVLPSYYEGLPLSAVEGLVSGCRLVISDLPTLADWDPPVVHGLVERVPLPRMVTVDRPEPADLPAYAERLADALARQIARAEHPTPRPSAELVDHCGWDGLFGRIDGVYRELVAR